MIETIILFFLFGIFAGFFFGMYIFKEEKHDKTTIKEEPLRDNPLYESIDRVGVGVIRRPDAKEIKKREEPKKVKEGKEAMKETLDKVPELQKAKEYIKKYKLTTGKESVLRDNPYEG